MAFQFRQSSLVPDSVHRSKPSSVLVVEDDRTSLLILTQHLEDLGYKVQSASDGETACEILESDPDIADVIVLDRSLPGMDGIDVARRLKETEALSTKPIIMVTGCGRPEQIKEGMDAGVFYYLLKPIENSVLQSVMSAAMRRAEEAQNLRREFASQNLGMSLLQSAKFRFRTPDEARSLAILVSGCFPDSTRALTGIYELFLNAIEHGNLEIGYKLKSKLLDEGQFADEVQRRLEQAEYTTRVVEVVVTNKTDGTYLSVTDEGAGFNPKEYLKIDPANSGNKNGRGIAQSRIVSFDKLGYNEKGNQAIGFISNDTGIDW